MRVRLLIACWIFPPFKGRENNWANRYYSMEHIRSVHKFYHNECRQLNKAITKKHKQVKQLQTKLADYELNNQNCMNIDIK